MLSSETWCIFQRDQLTKTAFFKEPAILITSKVVYKHLAR